MIFFVLFKYKSIFKDDNFILCLDKVFLKIFSVFEFFFLSISGILDRFFGVILLGNESLLFVWIIVINLFCKNVVYLRLGKW